MADVSAAPPGIEAATKHFKTWLKHSTGCSFASHLVVSGNVAYEAHAESPSASELDRNLDQYAAQQKAAILLFPFITSEAGLVEELKRLLDSGRWRITERTVADVVHIGIEWQTHGRERSDAMGFAPLPSMPVPRRAPYFAIGMWPGTRCNPLRGKGRTPAGLPGRVSFLDAAHTLGDADSDRTWDSTVDAVAELMTLPPDEAKRYRRVAFVLSSTNAGAFSPK